MSKEDLRLRTLSAWNEYADFLEYRVLTPEEADAEVFKEIGECSTTPELRGNVLSIDGDEHFFNGFYIYRITKPNVW
ncbi:MAG: hypothetical protein ACU843_07405 [Gammaproteobacteria bacterium]